MNIKISAKNSYIEINTERYKINMIMLRMKDIFIYTAIRVMQVYIFFLMYYNIQYCHFYNGRIIQKKKSLSTIKKNNNNLETLKEFIKMIFLISHYNILEYRIKKINPLMIFN